MRNWAKVLGDTKLEVFILNPYFFYLFMYLFFN